MKLVNINRIYVTISLCLLVVSIVGVQLGTPIFVSAALCQITSTSYDYPQPVQLNQQIQLTTTINATCYPTDPGVYYLALVVVQEASSGQQISISSTPIGYVSLQQPNVVANVMNLITSPNGNGVWQLKLTVYVINDYNQYFSPYTDTAMIHYISIDVGNVQQIVSSTISSTTTESAITTTSSAVETSTTEFQSTPTTSIESPNNGAVLSQGLTILGLALIVIVSIGLWKYRAAKTQSDTTTDMINKKKSKKDKTEETD